MAAMPHPQLSVAAVPAPPRPQPPRGFNTPATDTTRMCTYTYTYTYTATTRMGMGVNGEWHTGYRVHGHRHHEDGHGQHRCMPWYKCLYTTRVPPERHHTIYTEGRPVDRLCMWSGVTERQPPSDLPLDYSPLSTDVPLITCRS